MADDTVFRTVHLKFSDAELEVIDGWQEKKKIRTRSEAIRQLIRCSLDADTLLAKDDLYRLDEKPGQGFMKQQRHAAPDTDLSRLIREEVARAVAEALKGKR